MNELSDVIGIFDSREKNQKRIDSFCSFIETHGGITEKGTLKLCDYHILGSFKGKQINLGIEAKSLSDFASSYQDLPDKLGRAYEFYKDVGLFVEVGSYSYSKESDGFHSTINNRDVPDGSANVLNLAAFMNSLASWQHEGVHVRQLLSPDQFGDALVSVLVYITKDTHNGLNPIVKQSDNIEDISKWRFVNALIHLGIKNLGVKTALKFRQWLIDNNYPPNLHFATSIDDSWLQEILGAQVGKDLNNAFRSRAGWVWIDSKPNLAPSQAKPLGEQTPKSMSNEQGTEKSLKSNPEQNITNSNNLQLPEEHINQDSLKTKEVKAVLQSSNDKSKEVMYDTKNKDTKSEEQYNLTKRPGIQKDSVVLTSGAESPQLQLSDACKEPDSQAGSPACEMPTEVNPACLKSLSTEQLQNQSAEVTPQLKKELSTHDTLSSSSILREVSHTKDMSSSELQKLSNCDTHDKLQSSGVASTTPLDTDGGSFKDNLRHSPSVKFHEVKVRETIKSLEDAIVDYVYDKPVGDTEIITAFQMRGFKIPEIHRVLKESKKLWKYKQGSGVMIAYRGVKPEPEMNIGV